MPDGLTKHDIECAHRDLASSEYRAEKRWATMGKIGTVVGIVGGLAGLVSLAISLIG